jgi:hypothetical protein
MWLGSLALVAAILLPTAAASEPITAAITALNTWFAGLGAFAQFAVRLGASLVLSVLAQLLAPKPNTPDQKRELQLPKSRPPKRFVYGRNRTYGSPAPWRVKGSILYGCLILNSRPSHGGTIQIAMDKRECIVTDGDIFDFSGNGAILGEIEDFPTFGETDLGNPRVWIGLGDQTAPPDVFTTEVPEFFDITDGWQGCTVMWVRLDAGANDQRGDRWRAAPPEFEVEMDWSMVWDMREEAQDPDDPDTWTFSNNQALCLLDALRENPIRRYPLGQIHLPSFEESADVADEQVLRYYDSLDAETDIFEPRYTANGLIIWTGGELVDQLEPLVEAGGGDLVRIGGRVGYAAGEYRPSMLTIRDFIEDGGIEYQVLRPGRELPTFVKGVYISPERDWQEADLTPIAVEGAGDTGVGDEAIFEMRLPFVTSPTQAMRIQQITARKFAAQRTLSVVLWPEALDIAAGATVEVDLPPGFARLNGEWMVVSANPAVWVSDIQDDGDQEIALRIPVTLRETSESIYAWNPATDEQEVFQIGFTPVRPEFPAPANLTVQSGDGISTEFDVRLRLNFDPVPGAGVYEVFSRVSGQPTYALATTTEATSDIILSVAAGVFYDVQVRAVSRPVSGPERYSAFAQVLNTQALPEGYDLGIPLNGVATGGANEITVSFTSPNSRNYRGMEIWGSNTDSVSAATRLTTLFGAADTVKTFTETGLGNNVPRFYFARSTGDFGFFSAYTASVTATTDP